MKPLSKSASAILDKLTARGSRVIGEKDGGYMQVHVDKQPNNVWAIAHYYSQNGDQVSDPRMEFWKAETGAWFPVSIEMGGIGMYRVSLTFKDGQPHKIFPREFKDQASFATTWMRNIKQQQRI